MEERNERGVVIGGGPFQPRPASEVRDMVNEINMLKAERDGLRNRLNTQNTLLSVTAEGDIEQLLSVVLGRVADDFEISVTNGMGNESLEITVEGIRIDDDGNLAPIEREFEVNTTITFEHRATIRAADRDTAHDLYAEALRDSLHEVEITISHEAVDDQDSYEAEFDYINVNEL